jgi:hypothetical protein
MDRSAAPTRITLITHAATRQQKTANFPADEGLEELTIAKLAPLGWIAPTARTDGQVERRAFSRPRML